MVPLRTPPPVRRSYEVSDGGPPVRVRGVNWMHALGAALSCMGISRDISRLAAETLPNGTVIANDIDRGARYVVRPTG